ncbi:MAG: hypothetical protein AABY87_03930 [bacterium]
MWKYIRETLKVEEVTSDSFARKVDAPFLEKQTDEWFVEFYKQLAGQKTLWRKGSNSRWDNPGPLRSKPFIRLQDGGHVEPFRDHDSPNAYLPIGAHNDTSLPVVKAILAEAEDARRFLSELGIPELDIVAEVIEHIVPKYLPSSTPVSFEEHKRDIEKIERAFKTDSLDKRQRLKNALQETAFILTNTPDLERTDYRKASEVYFPDDTLTVYFSGNATVGFVSSSYEESALEIFRDLGASEDVRIRKKCPDHRGHIKIRDEHGSHERGLNGFDPEIKVEGLEHALASPSLDKSAFIWNSIAVPNHLCIRGIVEKSARQTYENSSRKECMSQFGRLLIENSWLPGPGGVLQKPSELRLDDLPDSHERNEKLATQLGMKKDVVAKLIEEAGVSRETLERARKLEQYPDILQLVDRKLAEKNEPPIMPNDPVKDSERRRAQLEKELATLPKKEYEALIRNVRRSIGSVDPRIYLREKYINNNRMVCQICKEEMPFKKRDGEYYFEAVEALSRDHFPVEHEAQFLALCPLCAAMYKEFVKNDEGAMEIFKNTLMNSETPEVSLQLGDLNKSIRFVESHFSDIRTILGGSE